MTQSKLFNNYQNISDMKLSGRLNAWYLFPFYISGFIHIIFIIKVAEIWLISLLGVEGIHKSSFSDLLQPCSLGNREVHPRSRGILELMGTWVAVYFSCLCIFLNTCKGTKINIRIFLRCYFFDVTSMPSGCIGFCDVCYIRLKLM